MVERVARAIFESAGFVRGINWPPPAVDRYRATARAAIAAMCEPTKEILEAGADLLLDGRIPMEVARANVRGIWRAMIDAALGRKG